MALSQRTDYHASQSRYLALVIQVQMVMYQLFDYYQLQMFPNSTLIQAQMAKYHLSRLKKCTNGVKLLNQKSLKAYYPSKNCCAVACQSYHHRQMSQIRINHATCAKKLRY